MSFSSFSISGRGAREWQSVIEALPADVGQQLNENFTPEHDYRGRTPLIMKAYRYYWRHTYANGYLTVIIQPAPPDHPQGLGEREALEALPSGGKAKGSSCDLSVIGVRGFLQLRTPY
jgi:hypothetical protein